MLSEVEPVVVPDWQPEPPIKGNVVAVTQLSDCENTDKWFKRIIVRTSKKFFIIKHPLFEMVKLYF